MKFKEFIKREDTTAGWFDDKEDTRPTFTTRQQELPGLTMHLGQSEINGKLLDKFSKGDHIVFKIKSNGEIKPVSVDAETHQKQKAKGITPEINDKLRVIVNRDGSVQDYQVVHKLS